MRRKMDFARLSIGLLMLMTLTTTCFGRSTSGIRREVRIDEDRKDDDNALEILGNNRRLEMFRTNYENDDSEDYRQRIMRKGMKLRASKRTSMEDRKSRRSLRGNDNKMPFNARRLEKMMEKAIIKIITGDLSTADMLLLKSLNYSLDEVLAIREREMGKKATTSSTFEDRIIKDRRIDNDLSQAKGSSTEASRFNDLVDVNESVKNVATVTTTLASNDDRKNIDAGDFDFEAYNKQAVYDYENGANKMYQQSEFEPISGGVESVNLTSDENENRTSDDTDIVDAEIRANFERANEPHVVFKIRYDDSEFDSGSDERGKLMSREFVDRSQPEPSPDSIDNVGPKTVNITEVPSRNHSSLLILTNRTSSNNENKPFQIFGTDVVPLSSIDGGPINRLTPSESPITTMTFDDVVDTIDPKNVTTDDVELTSVDGFNDTSGFTSTASNVIKDNDVQTDGTIDKGVIDDFRRNSVYEGLEWIEDDVYRVIPEVLDSIDDYDANVNDTVNETIDDSIDHDPGVNNNEIKNDTIDYLNENPDVEQPQILGGNSSFRNPSNVNLSAYQQLALAHRRDGNSSSPFDSQSQKAIEDIKLKVLAMTGRFNMSSGSNYVQRERLTMFSPICQIPRNTDPEAWFDSSSMNINFQLNLTSSDHVVVAKLRIYKLPQNNTAVLPGIVNEEEDLEEKKIRISIYFYTKSLKRHRSKKRLMDSVVIALTSEGSHLTLDVRSALRFWRQNIRSSHPNGNNHGLVIQVEDQDGRSLKPSQYLQQDSCHANETTEDEKAYQRVPALFVQACSRYVRVVNGEAVTYVNCRKSSRNGRH